MKKRLGLILVLALGLRLFRAGVPVFKEDEFTVVKAAAYIHYCFNDRQQCLFQPTNIRSKILALMTANETVPSLAGEVYFWDFIKDKASNLHHSRAWPHLYGVAAVYQVLGINELSSRLVSVIAGSLLIIAGYLFSRVMGASVNLSLYYSFLLAIAFPLVDFSRNARMYSVYGLVFLLLVGVIYRSKWFLAGILFLFAYWLQMLTLILPIAVLAEAVWQKRIKLAGALLLGLAITIGLNYYLKVDFFGRQFLTLSWPPHWFYLNWWFLGALVVLRLKHETYLSTILVVYLIVLTFFSRPDPAGAYLLALWPLALWGWLNWRRWLAVIIGLIIIIQFGLGINYLYFGRDGRAEIPQAYEVIKKNFNPGDKIYAVQLRDYYLPDLPADTPIIDLQAVPNPEFSGSGFIVWEAEKVRHLSPETVQYIQSHFTYLGSHGVEIYSFGK